MKLRTINWIYFAIGLPFFVYIAIRAIHIGATFDEVMTFDGPVKLSFFGMFFNFSPIANNHLLNTFLVKCLFSLGNDSLVIARLPNVLAFIFYAYFGYKLVVKNLSPLLGLGCFMLLLCNPFLLDFFSLARGYGLSLSFLMAALYFGSEHLRRPSLSNIYKSLIAASFSVISVFSMIYVWVGLAVFLNLVSLLKSDLVSLKKSIISTSLSGVALLGVIAAPMMRLIDAHALVYGGNTDFYHDTLLSLARYSLYHFETTRTTYIALNSSLVLLALVALLSYACKREWVSLKSLFLAILIAPIVLIILAHHLAGVLYPINRVSLFLYPLLALCLCFFLNDLNRYTRGIILLGIVTASSINFISNANSYKTALWSFESRTEQILRQLNERARVEGKVMNLACTSVLYQSIDFYIAKNDYPFLKVIRSSEDEIVPCESDYYILAAEDAAKITQDEFIEKWVRPLDLYDKDMIIEYPEEHISAFNNLRKHT